MRERTIDSNLLHIIRRGGHIRHNARYRVFKNFLLTGNGVFIYDPFALNPDKSYGKVVRYAGDHTTDHLIFRDMRRYPLRVQIFKSTYSRPQIDAVTKKVRYIYGVDGRVADLLQECMNFTMELQEPNEFYFGEKDANGSYNGVIGSIIRNELDVCLTAFFVKDYMVDEMEFSVSVYDDKLCICTPKAKRIPDSILPLLSIRSDLWLAFIISGFFCSTIWTSIRIINLKMTIPLTGGSADKKKIYLGKSIWQQYGRIFNDTWVALVRVNIVRYPPFANECILIASLCLVSVVFGAVFESSLATAYIRHLYYKDIQTLQELDNSGLVLMYKYTSMVDNLFDEETLLFSNLKRKLRKADIKANLLNDIAFKRGTAAVSRRSNLMLHSYHYIVNKQIWMVPQIPRSYTLSYVWPKNAPWRGRINQLLLRFQATGLLPKFIRDMQTDTNIRDMMIYKNEEQQHPTALTITDLQLAFYVIFFGSMMAGVTLIAEQFCFS
ncbi:LOW QUALITY PROTEIN: ionotropic receptor 100a, partial [Glossina fuscipes fuscipes]